MMHSDDDFIPIMTYADSDPVSRIDDAPSEDNRLIDSGKKKKHIEIRWLYPFIYVAIGSFLAMLFGYALSGVPPHNIIYSLYDSMIGVKRPPISVIIIFIITSLVFVFLFVKTIYSVTEKNYSPQVAFDIKSKRLKQQRDALSLYESAAQKNAELLQVLDSPGITIGQHIVDGTKKIPVFMNFEETSVTIAGTRSGKTTSIVVPMVVQAPGAAIVTSNKPDIVLLTRLIREEKGKAWVYDPMNLVPNQRQVSLFTWDPIDYVRTYPLEEQSRIADGLANVLINQYTGDSDRNREWQRWGADLLTGMIMAAAILPSGSMMTVYEWLHDKKNNTPITVLDSDVVHIAIKMGLQAIMDMPDKQRGSVYSMAQTAIGFMKHATIRRWVITDNAVTAFNIDDFLASTDTLYLLSTDKAEGAAPLISALVFAIGERAERLCAVMPMNRINPPINFILDEAANIVKWEGLPQAYSHYGSRGILLHTIFQNPSQPEKVWGKHGFSLIYGTASHTIIGSNIKDSEFLTSFIKIIGEFKEPTKSKTRAPYSLTRSINESHQYRPILTTDDIATIPTGRAIMFSTGVGAIGISLNHWADTQYSEIINESLRKYDVS